MPERPGFKWIIQGCLKTARRSLLSWGCCCRHCCGVVTVVNHFASDEDITEKSWFLNGICFLDAGIFFRRVQEDAGPAVEADIRDAVGHSKNCHT